MMWPWLPKGNRRQATGGVGVPAYMIVLLALVFLVGMMVRADRVPLSGAQSEALTYNADGALLRIAADLGARRLKISEGARRVYGISNRKVLVKREKNVQAGGTQKAALYLVETLMKVEANQSEQEDAQQRVQLVLVDLRPDGLQGNMKVGLWRRRPL